MKTAYDIEVALDAAFERAIPGSLRRLRPCDYGRAFDERQDRAWDCYPEPRDLAAVIDRREMNRRPVCVEGDIL